MLSSATKGTGIEEVWRAAVSLHEQLAASGELADRRKGQAVTWFWAEVTGTLVEAFRGDESMRAHVDELEAAVAAAAQSPLSAAQRLLELGGVGAPPSGC